MKYEDNIKTIATSDRDVFERGDILIKEINMLETSILDYRYAADHYDLTKGTVMQDEINKIKNNLVIVMGDLDVYAEQLGVGEEVNVKKGKRIDKIAKKAEKRR